MTHIPFLIPQGQTAKKPDQWEMLLPRALRPGEGFAQLLKWLATILIKCTNAPIEM